MIARTRFVFALDGREYAIAGRCLRNYSLRRGRVRVCVIWAGFRFLPLPVFVRRRPVHFYEVLRKSSLRGAYVPAADPDFSAGWEEGGKDCRSVPCDSFPVPRDLVGAGPERWAEAVLDGSRYAIARGAMSESEGVPVSGEAR